MGKNLNEKTSFTYEAENRIVEEYTKSKKNSNRQRSQSDYPWQQLLSMKSMHLMMSIKVTSEQLTNLWLNNEKST